MSDALLALIDRFGSARIIVAGDAMLDIYTTGTSTRTMPEAPDAPVVLVEDSVATLGGAANVAANITALGGTIDFICLTGDDAGRAEMLSLADRHDIPQAGFIVDDTRPTIIKERIVANGVHIARADREKTHEVEGMARENFLAYYTNAVRGAAALILSDYGKGALSDAVVQVMITAARDQNIPILVDSKRKDLSVFAGALLAKPNMAELAGRVGAFNKNDEAEIAQAARTLMAQSGIENLIASRSENGMMLVTPDNVHSYAATARHVGEVAGVGDTVLALTALAIAAGASLEDAVWLANIGAGAAVEKEKTSTITRAELKEALGRAPNKRKQA